MELLVQLRSEVCAELVTCPHGLKFDSGNQQLGISLRKVSLYKPVACAVRYVRAPRANVSTRLNFGEEKLIQEANI